MRRALCLLLAVFAGLPAASAQPYLLPYAGYAFEAGYDNGVSFLNGDDATLGVQGGLTVGLGLDVPFYTGRIVSLAARPSLEAVFSPGETVTFSGGETVSFRQRNWQAAATLVGEFPLGSAVVPLAGVGFTYARYTADFDASGGATIVGVSEATAWALAPSLLAGFRVERGRYAPVLQVRYRFATPSPSFSETRPGRALDNGLSVVIGARVAL